MSEEKGPRISRGEEAMYGELAGVVRQVSTAYVALTEGRDLVVAELQKFYREMHLPAGEVDSFGTAAEGTLRNEWEECFTLIANAEMMLQDALFGVTARALELRRASRAGVDSLPVFGRSLYDRVRSELDESASPEEAYRRAREILLGEINDSPERQAAVRLIAEHFDLPR